MYNERKILYDISVLAEHFHSIIIEKNDREINNFNKFTFILDFVTKTMFI